jgi:hypothetical protein
MNRAFFFPKHSGQSGLSGLAGAKERNDRRTFYRSRELIDIKRPVDHDSYITLNIRNVNPKIQFKTGFVLFGLGSETFCLDDLNLMGSWKEDKRHRPILHTMVPLFDVGGLSICTG